VNFVDFGKADWLGLAVVAGGLVAVVAALIITLIRRRGTAYRRKTPRRGIAAD
jgi:hypothetical protein